MAKNKDLFRQLTTLFRSGPLVRRKISTVDNLMARQDPGTSNGILLFKRSVSPTYSNITHSAYNLAERLTRYQDYQEMESMAEISAALDLYADETVSSDEKGRALHVYSDNEKIRQDLEELYYNILNTEFNLRMWARNLVKYGDMFLFNDVSPEHGVINAYPIPVNELEREDNFDPQDPFAVRYRWSSLGNRVLENWEVSHFRLGGNDMFLPYGSSMIEPARRIWRQLILAEDAMLVYRITRAPERRVFKIDVGNTSPEEVDAYIEEQRKHMRTNSVIDPTTGRVDLRYNAFSVDEDYILPVRGKDSGTDISTLPGGQNTAAIEDVAYLQKKLFAALKIPRAYLGFDESIGSRAGLAQEDIRFSRTITVIQKTLIAELNKLAIIHLFALGYRGDDLLDFTLRLSNPSTIAQQQKLELWRTKFEIASAVPEGMVSKQFIRTQIWGLNQEQCDDVDEQRYNERIVDSTLENLSVGGSEGPPTTEEGSLPGGGGEEGGGGDLADLTSSEEELPPEENASDTPEEEVNDDVELLMSSDDFELPSVDIKIKNGKLPVKVSKYIKDLKYNRGRRRTHGPEKTNMPNIMSGTKYDDDPYDSQELRAIVTNPLGESRTSMNNETKVGMTPDCVSAILRMKSKFGDKLNNKYQNNGVLLENLKMNNNDEIDDIFIVADNESRGSDE